MAPDGVEQLLAAPQDDDHEDHDEDVAEGEVLASCPILVRKHQSPKRCHKARSSSAAITSAAISPRLPLKPQTPLKPTSRLVQHLDPCLLAEPLAHHGPRIAQPVHQPQTDRPLAGPEAPVEELLVRPLQPATAARPHGGLELLVQLVLDLAQDDHVLRPLRLERIEDGFPACRPCACGARCRAARSPR